MKADFGDLVLRASRTGQPVADVVWADAFKDVRPVTERPIRPQFAGPCPGCGSRYFGCGCDD